MREIAQRARVLVTPTFALCLLRFAFCLSASTFCLRSSALPQSPAGLGEADRVAAAVVQLVAIGPGQGEKNRACSATGFLVNEEGYILTNAHVVEDARRCLAGSSEAKILAKLAPGRSGTGLAASESSTATAVSCDVVAVDDVHDLAVLKPERPLPQDPAGGPRPFALLNPREVPDGAAVTVTGHPLFVWQPTTQTGKILRRARLRLSDESPEASDVLVLDIPLKPGNSGSPVYLRSTGAVVGVVERQNGSNRSESVAVPVRYAVEMLDRLGIKWYGASNSP